LPCIHEAQECIHARPELGNRRRFGGNGIVQEFRKFIAVGIYKMKSGLDTRRNCFVFQVVLSEVAEKAPQRFWLKTENPNLLPHISKMEDVLALARPVVADAFRRQVQKQELLIEKIGRPQYRALSM